MTDDDLPLPERLRHWVDRLVHVLPAQAPIGDFVHHNTLHGLQHRPFAEALAAAHRLTGATPYLAEETFHGDYTAGRIGDGDLESALDDVGCRDLEAMVVAGLSRRRVLLAALLEPAAPPSPARLAWLRREWDEAGGTDGALWEACRRLTPEATPRSWRDEAVTGWRDMVAGLGDGLTRRTMLAALTGEDVLERVRTVLQRHLAAHLDLGVAAWRNPLRREGFYAAWRASAGADWGWELDDLPTVRDELAWLPDHGLALLQQELAVALPDEARWPGYLTRLALEQPGWSGMFLWRANHPERGDGAPVDMADYLAVRLLLERLLSNDLLRRLTGSEMDLPELTVYFAARPAEFLVRRHLYAGLLAEDLAHRARSLVSGDGRDGDEAWEPLAAAIAAPEDDGQGSAWQLFCLSRRLGLAAADLDAAGSAGVAALLQTAASLNALQRGHVWLLAYEGHYREQIFAALAANRQRPAAAGPWSAQAVFCMDDREEGTRRHLEEIAPTIETYGAAGFFGVAMAWRGVDDTAAVPHCPVAVRPAHRVDEEARPGAVAQFGRHRRQRGRRLLWRERFLQGSRRGTLAASLLTAAAAPAALVALVGSSLAPGWFGQALARWRQQFDGPVATRLRCAADDDGTPATPAAPRDGFTDSEGAERVAAFLRSIGLTDAFAPLVALVGHGSDSRNNPHRSAYDCGACSGRHGGPNARLFAALANRSSIRQRLADQGIVVPDTTRFVGAEHNTCDDSVEWYDTDDLPPELHLAFDRLVRQINEACRAHAAERCRRFASAPATLSPAQGRQHVLGRRHDIAQTRPELGHATNAAAFIGRRARSRGLFLDRRVFLISYDPLADAGGEVVEGILLAAGPVGAGISLEYYFSTVDNQRFGCGSKVTHNLAGLFGVMEGADSDLRTGLPWQMVEIHEAMRLLVVVEQTPAVLSAIVARQPALAELVGNGWVIVAAQDPVDGALHRYCPRRGWLAWAGQAVLPQVARSVDWFAGQRELLPPALLLEDGV